MDLVYHVTTPKKLQRYKNTKAILPPVRFWPNLQTALRWAKRTNRTVIISFLRPKIAYPLPDHKPALWSPNLIREYKIEWDELMNKDKS